MNGLQSLTQWETDFNFPHGSLLGLLNAIQVLFLYSGANFLALTIYCNARTSDLWLAYPFSPYLSDGWGRRPTVFFGAVIMCAGVAVQTASQSVHMFIGAR